MPRLAIKEGPGSGDAFELLQGTATIGRDAGNTLRLADRTLSRFHARITRSGGDCYVSDLESHNGTLVNGERIRRKKLNHMDEIRLGNVVLIFLEDDVSDADVLLRSEGAEPEITQTVDIGDSSVLLLGSGASRSELVISNQRLVALTELAQAVASVRGLPTLFDLAIDSVNRTLDPDRTLPIVCREDGALLPYIRAKSGFDRGVEGVGISKKVVEHSLKKGVAVLSRRAFRPGAARCKGGAEARQITSVLCAPLIGGRTHGVIYCDRVNRADEYERADLQHLCSVAAEIAAAMENIRAYEEVAARARNLEREVQGQYDLLGQSPPIREVFRFIRKAAPTGASVLICGESGTGKELVAHAIHFNSPRSKGPFEPVNCAAMSQSLIESELFGHVKGAFTGAIHDRLGRFELANKGTIFLDEIGALPLDCQTKLLRVLEEGTVRRVGDVKDRKVDVRVIAATNEDLDAAREQGRFRKDLFYRLDVLRTDLPPLRERDEDIELLAHHFLAEFSEKCGRIIKGFDPAVREVFHSYPWPGNVRELKNVVERMVIMCEDEILTPELLPAELCDVRARSRARASGPNSAAEHAADQLQEMRSLQEVEKRHILSVLRETGGNKKKTAEILGVDRSTLYAKLKRYKGG